MPEKIIKIYTISQKAKAHRLRGGREAPTSSEYTRPAQKMNKN